MTVDSGKWMTLAGKLKNDSIIDYPDRGNILSCNREVLASSLPQYNIYMDFMAGSQKDRDSMWLADMDSICNGLHRIFPEMSASQFHRKLQEGRRKSERHMLLWPRRIDYNTYIEVKRLPTFCLNQNKGGFHVEEHPSRVRPFETLASRTVGALYGAKDSARYGLELSFDSLLRGKCGYKRRRKVMNGFVAIPYQEAENGLDVVTTIDIKIQDLAEQAVMAKAEEIDAKLGIAMVMECSTGDMKAIVNLTKCSDSQYREVKNNAIKDVYEPGSVFKTASLMVALDDGMCDTTEIIETGNGVWHIYSVDMRDHNWRKGGYHTISLARAMEVSSNIGISKVINKYYKDDPQRFVDGLHRIGIAEDLHLPFLGYTRASVYGPHDRRDWSRATLPWMSIGYETSLTPITTLTFYNAIANGGKMVQPRFVTELLRDEAVEEEFPTVVLRDKICSEQTLKKVQTVLRHVVSQGLGKKAGSELFQVAGKTGTAQVSSGKAGYKTGDHLVSFAGYFPADKPMYSCIVCFLKHGGVASGGLQAGPVFKEIAEGVMADIMKRDLKDVQSTSSDSRPALKRDNGKTHINHVVNALGIDATHHQPRVNCKKGIMPDVKGMGARDVVCMLEKCGLKIKISGRGQVVAQSIPAGNHIRRGMVCRLEMK